MQIIRGIDQGSDAWHALRIGNPGASSFDKIVTSTGKVSTSRTGYLYQMAAEKLTGQKAEHYKNDTMQEGNDREDESRRVFCYSQDVDLEQVALCYPDGRSDYHCSPDALVVGQKKGFEVKNPLASTHCKYLDKGVIPTDYVIQVQGSLMVTEYDSWFFMSHFPGIKPLIIEVGRDEKLIKVLRIELQLFIEDLEKLVEKLRGQYDHRPNTEKH